MYIMESLSNKIIRYLILSSFIVIFSMIVWGINKGFDITDEGFYILGFQSDQECGYTIITNFQRIVKTFFSFITLDILNVRILRFVLHLLSTLIFSIAIKLFS